MSIPRPEYPRPQMVRESWLNLNGPWEFEIDQGRSGRERGLVNRKLANTIQVPFCPESKLSGIGNVDFMWCVWYRRAVILPKEWAGKRVLIHFGAVDYDTEVWVNGQSVGKHRGGYSSFSFEITAALKESENIITVCAEDDTRSDLQPTGKQCDAYESGGCSYTRTTGIWQTVWLEAVPQQYMGRPRITPDLENGTVVLEVPIVGDPEGLSLKATASLDGKAVGSAQVKASGPNFFVTVPLSVVKPWEIGSPTLYDLTLEMSDSKGVVDKVGSYFGLRSITLATPAILINGKPVFQRLILDQGFYPDGIYTAPTDDELRKDIERSMAMGFNSARLHQKVFEERFLYWADKLGYPVWGEMASWGLNLMNPLALERFITEWREILQRDYSHPSIVGWCPFNETGHMQNQEVLRLTYRLTKDIDATRPVIDTSGYVHVETDVDDCHNYDQNPETFSATYAPFAEGGAAFRNSRWDAPYKGQPYFVSEYGGIWWNPDQKDNKAWGYGDRPKSEEEFIARYKGLTEALLFHPMMCGFCYTQLTDVEQEVNGLYTYDRKPKFDPAVIKAINAQKAAIED
jgi:beta-galactosidase/beta-glucuronidase